jgi:hypothetical protein
MNAVAMPDLHNKNPLIVDDVHSFVLRLYLNAVPGSRSPPRPQFHLENVNEGSNQRMQSLDEVILELTVQIEKILQGSRLN